MSIADGDWTLGCCHCDDDEDMCSVCKNKLDSEEIVVPRQDFAINYTYPLSKAFKFEHHTDNLGGFTRREISVQIMERYHKIYLEETEDVGKETGNIDGILNRQTSNGRYGIWGHCIEDLYLHSLYLDESGVGWC